MGFLDGIGDAVSGGWDWLKDADNLKTVGTVVGGIAQGVGAYGNYQTAKEQSAISKELLAMQKADYNRGIEREDLAQDNFSNAINSSFTEKKETDEPTMAIA